MSLIQNYDVTQKHNKNNFYYAISKTEALYFTVDVLFCCHAFSGTRFFVCQYKE